MENRLSLAVTVCVLVWAAPVVLCFKPKLVQPALNPLRVGCMADTPILLHHCVMVWPHTNKPVTRIECRLGNVKTLNCSRSAVMFTKVPTGIHRLVITARTATEEVSATFKLVVPAGPDICTAHLINGGVEVENRTAVAEFGGYGPLAGFQCKVDSPVAFPCSSPLVLEGLSVGDHWLRVIPVGCREGERQTFFFTVPPSPPAASTQSSLTHTHPPTQRD